MTRAEFFARECRKALTEASLAERAGQVDLADACGAIAGNKLAQAIRLAARESVVEPIERWLARGDRHAVKPSIIVDCPACDGGYRDVGNRTVMCGQCRGTGRVATNGGEP